MLDHLFPGLTGLEVILDESMVVKKWVFPKDRFVQWGPEDEAYCRFAHYGHEEKIPCSTIYRIENKLVCHPYMWQRLKEEIDKQNVTHMSQEVFVPEMPAAFFATF